MEALETTIGYWEDALSAYGAKTADNLSLAVTNVEDAEFSRELQKLLDAAYNLQEESELLFLDQVRIYDIFNRKVIWSQVNKIIDNMGKYVSFKFN